MYGPTHSTDHQNDRGVERILRKKFFVGVLSLTVILTVLVGENVGTDDVNVCCCFTLYGGSLKNMCTNRWVGVDNCCQS